MRCAVTGWRVAGMREVAVGGACGIWIRVERLGNGIGDACGGRGKSIGEAPGRERKSGDAHAACLQTLTHPPTRRR